MCFSMDISMEKNQSTTVDGQKKLSRHKRYMAFPEGSELAVLILNYIIVKAETKRFFIRYLIVGRLDI